MLFVHFFFFLFAVSEYRTVVVLGVHVRVATVPYSRYIIRLFATHERGRVAALFVVVLSIRPQPFYSPSYLLIRRGGRQYTNAAISIRKADKILRSNSMRKKEKYDERNNVIRIIVREIFRTVRKRVAAVAKGRKRSDAILPQ